MMEDWREQLIKDSLRSRIHMYRDLMEAVEKDIQWAEDQELPELANWFAGRVKGYAAAQDSLRSILKMFPGEGDA